MKFEIVEFYPFVKNPKSKKRVWPQPLGTVHVYWIDQEIDLRGIQCAISPKSGIYYLLPFLTAYDPKETRMVRYPAFAFTDPKKSAELENFLKKEATPLVEKYLQENPKLDKRIKATEVKNG